ncbi:hypothetical protein J4446_01710 [Candidatus Woesearchaeota archaeon]|nr:hypothetical protein [Candidatus Woesearchaeota archaeon]
MKKGQTETVGLVIIVILLIFIAIFALSFSIKPKQENDDILKLKANALRASVLKTNLCGSVSVKDELENCIDGYNECIDCGELSSEVVNIIKNSLENEKYSFTVFGNNEVFMKLGGCVENITAVSENLGNGVVEVSLCRR